LVPSSPNPPINKGIESAIDPSIKQEFFNTISPYQTHAALRTAACEAISDQLRATSGAIYL
jgi:hypothetical protein